MVLTQRSTPSNFQCDFRKKETKTWKRNVMKCVLRKVCDFNAPRLEKLAAETGKDGKLWCSETVKSPYAVVHKRIICQQNSHFRIFKLALRLAWAQYKTFSCEGVFESDVQGIRKTASRHWSHEGEGFGPRNAEILYVDRSMVSIDAFC